LKETIPRRVVGLLRACEKKGPKALKWQKGSEIRGDPDFQKTVRRAGESEDIKWGKKGGRGGAEGF